MKVYFRSLLRKQAIRLGFPAIVVSLCLSLSNHAVHAAEPLSYVTVDLRTSWQHSVPVGISGNTVVGSLESGYARAVTWDLTTGGVTFLNSTGYATTYGRGIGNGYVVGDGLVTAGGYGHAVAWNLTNNSVSTLNDAGALYSHAYFVVGNYAVGEMYNSTLGNNTFATKWNLATGMPTLLDATGLVQSYSSGYTNGYIVGYGYISGVGQGAMIWDAVTNVRTSLDRTGLWTSAAYGAGTGYAVGYSVSSYNAPLRATAWNIATGTRTTLDSTGLGNTYAYAAGNGYAAGIAQLSNNSRRAYVWDLGTGQRTDIQGNFLPGGITDSTITDIDESGTIVGYYGANGGSAGYALIPFKAWQGDTLAAGKIARVTSSINQTTGVTTLNGNYLFVGGAGNDTYTISGGTLRGTGTITGNLNNIGGVLAPGESTGALTINGNFVQGAGGTLSIEIASTTDFDRLFVRDSAVLGGTLNLSFAPDFIAGLPASFDLLTTGNTITGAFDQVNIIGGLPGGASAYYLTTSNVGSGMKLTLTVVPEANTLSLLVLPILGGAVLTIRKRLRTE